MVVVCVRGVACRTLKGSRRPRERLRKRAARPIRERLMRWRLVTGDGGWCWGSLGMIGGLGGRDNIR